MVAPTMNMVPPTANTARVTTLSSSSAPAMMPGTPATAVTGAPPRAYLLGVSLVPRLADLRPRGLQPRGEVLAHVGLNVVEKLAR